MYQAILFQITTYNSIIRKAYKMTWLTHLKFVPLFSWLNRSGTIKLKSRIMKSLSVESSLVLQKLISMSLTVFGPSISC